MKLLTFILSIYFISIACYPCADGASIEKSHETEKTADHSHESDSCPPFCICNCCGVQILSVTHITYFQPALKIFEIKMPPSSYKPNFISDYFGSIWQPPQIA